MKQLIILTIITIKTLSIFPSSYNDFGFRLSLGGISGIKNKIYPEISAMTHFHCFSDELRMVFGPTAIISTDMTTPTIILHQIGLEYNGTLQKIPIILGIRYYKSFIHDDQFEFDGGKNGWGLFLGTKKQLAPHKHFIFMIGWLDQVLNQKDIQSNNLDNNQMEIKTGLDWLL